MNLVGRGGVAARGVCVSGSGGTLPSTLTVGSREGGVCVSAVVGKLAVPAQWLELARGRVHSAHWGGRPRASVA